MTTQRQRVVRVLLDHVHIMGGGKHDVPDTCSSGDWEADSLDNAAGSIGYREHIANVLAAKGLLAEDFPSPITHGRTVSDPHSFNRKDGVCTRRGCEVRQTTLSAENWSRHLRENSTHMIVYTIDNPPTCSCGAQPPFADLLEDHTLVR